MDIVEISVAQISGKLMLLRCLKTYYERSKGVSFITEWLTRVVYINVDMSAFKNVLKRL